MKKGILKTLLFYGIGFGLAGILSLTLKNPPHAPGLNHIVMLFTICIGVIWTVVTFIMYLMYKKDNLMGIVLGNILIFIILFSSMTYH